MFLSEVAHRSFSAKFSELTQKNHKSASIHTYRVIFGLFLKVGSLCFKKKKIYGAPIKPSGLFCCDKDRLYYAAASQPRVFARPLVGNKK